MHGILCIPAPHEPLADCQAHWRGDFVMQKGQSCKTCNGTGALNLGSPQQPSVVTCPNCGGEGKQPDPGLQYSYEITLALTNQNVIAGSVTVQKKDFEWQFFTYVSTGAFLIQVFDGFTQRPFQNSLTHIANIAGTGQNPMPLLTPFIFLGAGQIQVSVQDLSGASSEAPNNVYLCFLGKELDSSAGPW
jgi:hypothetical protein